MPTLAIDLTHWLVFFQEDVLCILSICGQSDMQCRICLERITAPPEAKPEVHLKLGPKVYAILHADIQRLEVAYL
jgi:hypothetical protein